MTTPVQKQSITDWKKRKETVKTPEQHESYYLPHPDASVQRPKFVKKKIL